MVCRRIVNAKRLIGHNNHPPPDMRILTTPNRSVQFDGVKVVIVVIRGGVSLPFPSSSSIWCTTIGEQCEVLSSPCRRRQITAISFAIAIWKHFCTHFSTAPPLPPPFMVINFLLSLFHSSLCCCCCWHNHNRSPSNNHPQFAIQDPRVRTPTALCRLPAL